MATMVTELAIATFEQRDSQFSYPPRRELPPSFGPFMREADLARMCLADGLNALIRAHHMNKGLFSQAFFNTSVGLERLMKLIYLIDHGIRHNGVFPSQKELKDRFNHDLAALFNEMSAIREVLCKEGVSFEWELPDPDLVRRIVDVLAEFAKKTRYYNLDYLVGAHQLGRDPLEAWATEVGAYLLRAYPDRLRQRDEDWATFVESTMGDRAAVLQEAMDGSTINTLATSVLEGRRGEWIQKQATFHTATLVRYLVEVLTALNQRCGAGAIIQLPFLWEGFAIYYNSDTYLRGRRTFLA